MINDRQLNTDVFLEPMPEDNIVAFADLLRIQAKTNKEARMVVYLVNWLQERNIYYEIDKEGNILVTKGKALFYPCIVSHMDTVHDIYDDLEVFTIPLEDSNREHITCYDSNNKQLGRAGDDQCGIYACLYMLEKFDNIKAVFFTNEEGGCKGSSEINLDWFANTGYIIQLDRWGSSDFIDSYYNNPIVSKEFTVALEPLLKEYGYSSAEGVYTDSVKLASRKVGKSCVNISTGYYQHHSKEEFTDLNEFWHAIKFTENIIKLLGETEYPHTYTYTSYSTNNYSRKYNNYNHSAYSKYGSWDDDWDNDWNQEFTPEKVVETPKYNKKEKDLINYITNVKHLDILRDVCDHLGLNFGSILEEDGYLLEIVKELYQDALEDYGFEE